MINFARYDVFRTIAEAGGITAAAQRLCKTPSAVHYQLRALEQSLGQNLFERVGRTLQLTAAGRFLLEGVAGGLTQIRLAEGRLLSGGLAHGPLRIATVSGFGRYRLTPALFAALPASRPLQLEFGTHEQILDAVRSGRADLGVTYRSVVSTPIGAFPLATEQLVLLAQAGQAKRMRGDLSSQTFVTYDEYDYVFAQWFDAVHGRQPSSLRRGDHFAELEEAMESVAQGRGVSIVPKDAWCNGPWKMRLVQPHATAVADNTLYLIGTDRALKSADASLLRKATTRKRPRT